LLGELLLIRRIVFRLIIQTLPDSMPKSGRNTVKVQMEGALFAVYKDAAAEKNGPYWLQNK
jgi:hypothetical protein